MVIVAIMAAVLRFVPLLPMGRSGIESLVLGRGAAGSTVTRLEGLEGDIWSRFRIAHLAISDQDGVWLEIDGLSVDWKPSRLAIGRLRINAVRADAIAVHRQPIRPATDTDDESSNGVGAPSLVVDRFRADVVTLDQAVLGVPATLLVSGGWNLEGERRVADLLVERRDVDGDRLEVTFERFESRLDSELRLNASAGGPFAALLRMDDRNVNLEAALQFAGGEGNLNAIGAIDGEQALSVDLLVEESQWQGEARLLTRPFGGDALAQIIGDEVTLSGDLSPRADRRRLRARAQSDAFTMRVRGTLPRRTLAPDAPLSITASLNNMASLLEARGIPASAGVVELEGEAVFEPKLGFNGEMRIVEPQGAGVSADALIGPFTASRSRRRALRIETDLTAENATGEAWRDVFMGDAPRMRLTTEYNLADRSVLLEDFTFDAAAGEISLEGRYEPEESVRVEGSALLTDLSMLPGLNGGSAQIALNANGALEALEVTAEGQTSNADYADPALDSLLGPDVSLAIDATATREVLTVRTATLTGQGISVDGNGALGGSEEDQLRFTLLTPEGFDVSSVQAQRASGSITLSGQLSAPIIALQANADALSGYGVSTEQTEVSAQFSPRDGGLAGPVNARILLGPDDALTASAAIAFSGQEVRANNISINGRQAQITGDVRRSNGAVRAQLNGRYGADEAIVNVSLTPSEAGQTVVANAQFADLKLTETLQLASGQASVRGPLDNLTLSADVTAATPEPVQISADGTLARSQGAMVLTLSPEIRVRRQRLSATEPLRASYANGDLRINGGLAGENGETISTALVREGGSTQLNLTANAIPAALIAALLGREPIAGAIDASVQLSGQDALTGPISVTARNLGLEGDSDAGLDVVLDAQLSAQTLAAQASASSSARFNAQGQFSFGANADAWPPRLSIQTNSPLSASAQARGDVGQLWSVFGSDSIALSGEIRLDASASGSLAAPSTSGSVSWNNGYIEDARSGLLLEQISASADLRNGSVILDEFQAQGRDGGVVDGRGRYMFAERRGELEFNFDQLNAVNLAYADVRASGDVELLRTPDRTTVNGDILINEAELSPPEAAGRRRPATLAVTEVNRPDTLPKPQTYSQAPPELRLNVKVRADQQVFFRGYGLETEWQGDVDASGRANDPRLNGEASVVRGELNFVGQRFELERAEVRFNGDVEEGQIDVVAVRETSDLTARVTISGTVSDPTFALSSTPSLPDDEILSRLLFSRSTSRLSPLEAAQLAETLYRLSQGGGPGVVDQFRTTIGLDRLAVRQSEEGETVVAGGVYLNEDVYVEVATSPTGETDAEIQWRITRLLEIISRVGRGPGASVDVRWRRDY